MRHAALSLYAVLSLLPVADLRAQALLEEVLVTAHKREQRQQEVPASILAGSGSSLRSQTLVSAEALAAQLPNVHVSQSAVGDKLFIRGVGSGINAGFEQSVGLFIDGVYHGRSLQSRSQFLDIERVEVLRGPQGTYFGSSAIAGALNIASTSASAPGGYISSHYEIEHRERHLEGAAGTAVTEQLSLRVAGLRRSMGGWVRNLETGASEGAEDSHVLRLALAWDPADTLRLALKVERGAHRVQGRNIEVLGCPPPTGAAGTCLQATAPVLTSFGAGFTAPLYPRFNDWLDGKTQYSGPVHPGYTNAVATLGAREAGLPIPLPDPRLWRQDHSSLHTANTTASLQWQLADNLTLNSVSGFTAYDAGLQQGSDFMPQPAAAVGQTEDFRQLSQELRLAAQGARLDWMLGWYWQHGDLRLAEDVNFYLPPPYFQPAAGWFTDPCRSTAAPAGPCRLPATIAAATSLHAQQDYQQAVFMALEWRLGASLRASVEGRYLQAGKTLQRKQQLQDLAPGVTVPCAEAIAALAGCSAGLPLLLTAPSPPAGTAFGWRSGTLQLRRRDRDLMPAARLQWEPTAAHMLYASFSEGFKAGGFDQRNLFLDARAGQFEPERVTAAELGLKQRFPAAGLSLDLALFHSRYRDMQVSTFDGVVNFLVNNAASAAVRGIETNLRWQPTEHLGISTSMAWLDARWRSYHNAQCPALALANAPGPACRMDPASGLLVQDLSGQPLLMAPRYSGNVALDHVLPLDSGLRLHSQLLTYFETAKYLAADNDPATLQAGFVKLNLRVALQGPRGWELALVLRNLTDVRSMAHAEDLPLGAVNSFFALADRPRSIALQGQYRF